MQKMIGYSHKDAMNRDIDSAIFIITVSNHIAAIFQTLYTFICSLSSIGIILFLLYQCLLIVMLFLLYPPSYSNPSHTFVSIIQMQSDKSSKLSADLMGFLKNC